MSIATAISINGASWSVLCTMLRWGQKLSAKKRLQHPRIPDGRFIDPNLGTPINGKFHYGHRYGHEHRRLVEKAKKMGMDQKQFNDWINRHPEWFQIEDPKSNRSHLFGKPGK